MIGARPQRTVISRLQGGLGNQLFQYAVGRALAIRHRRLLLLDDLALGVKRPGATLRAYRLGPFRIRARLLSQAALPPPNIVAKVFELERGFHREVLAPSTFRHIYLHGYWQDERYFVGIRQLLQEELIPRSSITSDCPWALRITNSPSPVCVHVRRGDYLDYAGRKFGFVGQEYYRRAIRAVAGQAPASHFFIFSDDIPWCRRHMRIAYPHAFVSYDGSPDDAAYRDFGLMTLCHHFVIANSSLSWWGAWLGGRRHTITVAPRRWFRDASLDSQHMTPERWLRL